MPLVLARRGAGAGSGLIKGSLSMSVRSGADDGYGYRADGGATKFISAGGAVIVNDISSSRFDYQGFAILKGLNGAKIPQGATITKAELVVQVKTGTSIRTPSKLGFENVGDPVTPESYTQLNNKTTASMLTWTPDSSWLTGKTFTIDMKTQLQEVVSRTDFVGDKVCFLWRPNQSGWNGENNNYQTYEYDDAPSKALRLNVEYSVAGGGDAPVVFVAQDTFNRADGNTENVATTTGHIWESPAGTWVIANNRAKQTDVNSTRNLLLIETGLSDIEVGAKVIVPKAERARGGVVFRCKDADNFLRWHIAGTANDAALMELAGGTQTTLATVPLASGLELRTYDLKAVAVGRVIDCYLDGVKVLSYTMPADADASATKAGLYNTNIATTTGVAEFDNFYATTPGHRSFLAD